jgi:hypothetical protein
VRFTAEQAEHFTGSGLITGFTDDFAAENAEGVRSDDDGIRVAGGDRAGFFKGQGYGQLCRF